MRARSSRLFVAAACVVIGTGVSGAPGSASTERTIRVTSEAQFAQAVAALRDSGGTIVLLPHDYRGALVVSDRSANQLRIVGGPGARVGRVLLDHTQHVSLGRLRLTPLGEDARIVVSGSDHVDLHDLVVTAQGTPFSASIELPDARHVSIRRSTFTHCGDRSPDWSNCLLLYEGANDVLVEDSWFHDCLGCDFVHGRVGTGLTLRRNRFERTLPCRIGRIRCGHQDLIELFAGQQLLVEDNHFGVYRIGGAQLYLTNAIDHVRIVNNVFVGTDPLVPGYRAKVGIIVGSRGSSRLPHDVLIANNTILTGAARADGYAGSIRMSSRYGGLPRRERPILANNVIGLLRGTWPVCNVAQVSVSNVVLRGRRCSRSDRVGPAYLDARGRPTSASALLIGRASRRYAPARDIIGRSRAPSPDIGAFQHRS
jgi:hypothetical protein